MVKTSIFILVHDHNHKMRFVMHYTTVRTKI